MKSFNENAHMCCPSCGFEVVRIFRQGTRNAYLFKDGTIDMATREVDKDSDTTQRNMCNSVKCDWSEIINA